MLIGCGERPSTIGPWTNITMHTCKGHGWVAEVRRHGTRVDVLADGWHRCAEQDDVPCHGLHQNRHFLLALPATDPPDRRLIERGDLGTI